MQRTLERIGCPFYLESKGGDGISAALSRASWSAKARRLLQRLPLRLRKVTRPEHRNVGPAFCRESALVIPGFAGEIWDTKRAPILIKGGFQDAKTGRMILSNGDHPMKCGRTVEE